MRIFLITSAIPDPKRQAIHIVLDTVIREALRQGHKIVYQHIFPRTKLHDDAQLAELKAVERLGVEVLPPLGLQSNSSSAQFTAGGRLKRFFGNNLSTFYPETALEPEVSRRVKTSAADAVFIFWNQEGLAAAYGLKGTPKFVYYGMPDDAASAARYKYPELFDIPHKTLKEKARLLAWQWENRTRGKCHLKLMLDCQAVSNLSSWHAQWYAKSGHPRSLYIQNIWPDTSQGRWGTSPEKEKARPFKILASVGRPFSTGNTFGLHYLGTQILPLLREKLGAGAFELHICGRGEATSAAAESLRGSEVKWRGWVPDIDEEIRSAHLFLITNNTGFYKGAHTRFLHAWSLGSCVVAHTVNTRYMPEIRHGHNTLLGSSPEEISDWVVKALYDPELRKRIGEGGRRTYEEIFTPPTVVSKILQELQRCAGGSLMVPTTNLKTERSYQPQ